MTDEQVQQIVDNVWAAAAGVLAAVLATTDGFDPEGLEDVLQSFLTSRHEAAETVGFYDK